MRKRIFAAVAALSLLGASVAALIRERPVATGVLSRTPTATTLHWMQKDIVLHPSPPGTRLSPQTLSTALTRAARTWNDALDGCGAPRLRVSDAAARPLVAREDGISVVVVQTGEWCPADANDRFDCYDSSRQGITHLYPWQGSGPEHGGLREADIEINGADFLWSLDGSAPGTRHLEALLVHELGHVLGLDHPCGPASGAMLTFGGVACTPERTRDAAMFPDPTELGREPVLAPSPGEAETLCQWFRSKRP